MRPQREYQSLREPWPDGKQSKKTDLKATLRAHFPELLFNVGGFDARDGPIHLMDLIRNRRSKRCRIGVRPYYQDQRVPHLLPNGIVITGTGGVSGLSRAVSQAA